MTDTDCLNQLQTLKNLLTSAMDLAPAGLALMRGPDFIFEYTNETFEKLMSSRPHIGLPWGQVYKELKATQFPGIIKRVYETGDPYSARGFRVTVSAAPGTQMDRYYDIDYVRTYDAKGEPYGIACQCCDVTESVVNLLRLERSEELLRSSEERLSNAVAVSKVGFYDWNILTNHLNFSPQMKLQWGFDGDCGLEDVVERIHPEDRNRVISLLSDAMFSHNVYQTEYRVNRPDGSTIWVEAQGRISYDSHGNPIRFFGTSIDISDKKGVLLELEIAKSEAERANAAKSAFLANMSHEIRTPLGAILGYGELIKETQSGEDCLKYASIIIRNGKALTRLIDDILDLSKVEAGRLELENEDFSLRSLVEEVANLFQEVVRTKGIRFRVKVDADAPEMINSDPSRLRQILLNLIGNAIKFTERGEVELLVKRSFKVSNKLSFQIRDTGLGMSSEEASRLFEPFMQADNSTTRRFGGTGLGLVLSRQLAQNMGGDVQLLTFARDEGCIFEATIRYQCAKKSSTRALALRLPAEDLPVKKVRVLLVEDSEDNRFLVEHALTKAGVEVDIAENGAQGIQKAMAANADYDVILMDMQMPVMDGYTATKKLRAQGYNKPIVAITAHAMTEECQKVKRIGCDMHIPKPLNFSHLVQTVREYASKFHRLDIPNAVH